MYLIAALAQNNCIGQNNQLPWHLPEDLKHFKELTANQTVLMGRKTFESILNYLGKPLPGRRNLVITGDTNYQAPQGTKIYQDIQSAIKKNSDQDIFVIGGASIYKQTINLADKLFITRVNQVVNGDAFFPDIDPTVWHEQERENHNKFSFITYEKI
ncbi:MAG: hypothetical protein COU31_02685 [Candidatus Magasanikbacteria bacterium CG10_big_fil_rev_8_21_14_0_10_40_10]|uniref:Dihydrofolate reductase n=1 Tax=Candidatus Magasanikbacteria bacterium CG10_big_fil_rev_8_21_14_0_10_40_10 TaxID=1974648 RepID=A0A2M6W441_9BACT|nr:MAG: hypothetical protein COU31_02685 [Candidatus Magasanikbacteria bacterium CG10_big_fil_rev_8_21_14_0_10_40_10]